MEKQNEVYLSGKIVKISVKKSVIKGIIEVKRNSGALDQVPFITKQPIDTSSEFVSMKGRIQTKNVVGKDGKGHKKMYVFADEVYSNKIEVNRNEVEFCGTIVSKEKMRNTPLGRTVIDVVVAINDDEGHSNYPAVIVWGLKAKLVDDLEIGSNIYLYGRFQSRNYEKNFDGKAEVRTAYEISTKLLEVI